ncbi:MAG: FkbM family methyltransferase [Roseibium album]|uniref:FkbM family methyltransferase n=1 Tax=Roseibium album TaxID=311410 RepID=UPI0032EBEBF3
MIDQELVFDVGAHMGEDTDLYLKLGYRVIAVEASPQMLQLLHERFSNEIESQRLVIVGAALVPADYEENTVTFFVNQHNSEWSSISNEFVERNRKRNNHAVSEVTVPIVKCADLFERYGTPVYLKVDVEGADQCALDAVCEHQEKPNFFSIESSKTDLSEVIFEIRRLFDAGYKRFAVVQQAGHGGSRMSVRSLTGECIEYKFNRASSGAFGDDLPSSSWMSADDAIANYKKIFVEYKLFGDQRPKLIRGVGVYLGRLRGSACPGWYDTHARLD